MEVRLLGAFEVLRDGVLIPDEAWGRKKAKTLLKVLLTEPGRIFTQDQLIEALFEGESPKRGLENLYSRVSELRRALEPGLERGTDSSFIRRRGQGYLFDPTHAEVDTLAFQKALRRAESLAEAKDLRAAAEVFEAGVALYRGELLVEDRYEAWAEGSRSQLRDQYLEALSRLAECYEALGRLRQAISCCQRVLQLEPYREGMVRQVMEYLYRAGWRAQALDAYSEGVRALREHLDVEPAAETRALYEQISRRATEESALDPRRVAVIPFVNVGADPANELLSDGMTEELIYTLSKVAGLEVIAQTSVLKYKGLRRTVREIGRELRAGSLIEGSTQRIEGRARILVQLVDAANEAHLWAEQYDRELQDVLSVQGEIARRVAEALEVTLLAKEERAICREDAVSVEARTAYTKGRLFLSRRTPAACRKAIAFFENALIIAPDYARALTGLADAYLLLIGTISSVEGHEKARTYAEQALGLDPACAEAHTTLGYVLWQSDGNVKQAKDEFLRAIELNPNYALAHEWYAGLLAHTGRLQEACSRSESALALDPLSAGLILSYAQSLHQAGRLDEAVDEYRMALEVNPELEDAWWGLWYSLAAAWDWDRAEAITRQTIEQYPDKPFGYVNLATCIMCRGRLEEGLVEIRKALAVAGNPVPPSILDHAGHCHYFGRRYDQAIGYYRQVLGQNPSWNWEHNMIAKCCIEQNRCDEALEELDAAERMFGGADPFWNAHVHMDRGIVYVRRGETEKAEGELDALVHGSGRQNRRICAAGVLYALGRVDEALDWLEAAATARESHVAALRKVPTFDGLREHPRFQTLLKRIGLADA